MIQISSFIHQLDVGKRKKKNGNRPLIPKPYRYKKR